MCEFLHVFFNYSHTLLLSSSSGCYPLWIIPCFVTSLKNIYSLFFPCYPLSLGFLLDFRQPVVVGCKCVRWLCWWCLCVTVFLGAGDCVSSKLGGQEWEPKFYWKSNSSGPRYLQGETQSFRWGGLYQCRPPSSHSQCPSDPPDLSQHSFLARLV